MCHFTAQEEKVQEDGYPICQYWSDVIFWLHDGPVAPLTPCDTAELRISVLKHVLSPALCCPELTSQFYSILAADLRTFSALMLLVEL